MLPGAVLTRVAASHLARRHVRVLRGARRPRAAAQARRLHDRAPRSRAARRRRNRTWRCCARSRTAQAALIAQWMNVGLHPRRDEHRQHDDLGRDDRLRPVRVHGGVRSGRGVQLHRPRAAATRSATSRASRRGTSRAWPRRCCRCCPMTPTQAIAMATEVIEAFPAQYAAHLLDGQRAKLGLASTGRRRQRRCRAGRDWLALLHAQRVDFTLAWRRLADAAAGDDAPLRALFADPAALDAWLARWRARCASEDAGTARRADGRDRARAGDAPRQSLRDPAQPSRRGSAGGGVRPGDLAPFERLLDALTRPYDETRNWRRTPSLRRPRSPRATRRSAEPDTGVGGRPRHHCVREVASNSALFPAHRNLEHPMPGASVG